MKTFKLYNIKFIKVLTMLMAIVATAACTDEEIISGTVEEGTPVTVNFQIATPKQDLVISTRSMDDNTANKVENLYVLGFNTAGTKIFGFYYTKLADGTTEVKSQSTIPAGAYDIYAIANIDSDVYGVDENTDNTGSRNLKSFLDDNALTKDNLLNKAVSILNSAGRSLDRSGTSLLMAGALCDAKGNVISVNINQENQKLGTINLKRLDSEITFNFKGGPGVSFTAKRWYVMNAPIKSYLIEQEIKDASNADTDFFNTYKEKEEDRAPVYNNTFTFYMPENKKTVKDAGCEFYTDREKEVKKNDGSNDVDLKTQRRNYKYAPNNGTYVVVTGHYEGPQKESTSIGAGTSVTAEVQYIIHLGYVKKVANDFFSERNVKYTYNVTVSGVDNIILEVEKGEENQPGATGDVVLGGSDNVYTLDAHYETVLLTFDYDELVKAWDDGKITDLFTSVVTTPYTSMLGSNQEASDQKWVKVIKNANASEEFQSYYAVKDRLQTVQAMLDELKSAVKRKDSSIFTNGKITYTCFVDEFYYEEEDLPVERTALADPTNIWKSFVNRPNRKMYIICNRKYSLDQESSIISSKYVISQRSIQTFYSTEPTPNEKVIAYGIETLNEMGNQYSMEMWFANHPDNGWANSRIFFNKITWSDINDRINGYKDLEMNKNVNKYGNLNPEAEETKDSNYILSMVKKGYPPAHTFTYGCMQRNRRELSTGTSIDDGDLKWYLPSINQYQSFYIGEPALSQESRLFDYPTTTVRFDSYQFIKHYGSSTKRNNNPLDVLVFWAEEATSVSTLQEQVNWADGSSSQNAEAPLWRRRALAYRCVRNLGSDGTSGVNTPGEYTPYRNVDKTNGQVVFKVDQLNPLLRSRGRATGELGPHFYQDRTNQFYTNGFEVTAVTNDLETTLDKATGVDPSGTGCESLNKSLSVGEAQWRVPNLRELTLMWQANVINDDIGIGRATSRTKMPYKYTNNNFYRKGWTVTNTETGTNLGMSKADDHRTTVRCVRDLK